jgi:hypothetical protein
MTAADESFDHRLDAYIDGELDAVAAAEVAAAVARDRALAARVATLARLKAETRRAFAAPAMPLAATVPRRPRRTLLAALAAAAAVAAAVLVWSGWRIESAGWLEPALAQHGAWIAGQAAGDRVDLHASRLMVGLHDLGSGAQIVDLSAADLQIAKIEFVTAGGMARAVHVGYLGSRGCRVSLWIGRGGGPAAPLQARFGGTSAEAWQVDRLTYVLLATGMAAERFELIARSVREATVRRAPFTAEARQALRESRDHSLPCA